MRVKMRSDLFYELVVCWVIMACVVYALDALMEPFLKYTVAAMTAGCGLTCLTGRWIERRRRHQEDLQRVKHALAR